MYDCAIIGGGPAGVSAALNLSISGKNFIWLGSAGGSRRASRAELIKNYPALPDITGEQFMWALLNHASSMGIELTEKVVSGVYDTGGKFSVLAGNDCFEAKTVILCTGVAQIKPAEGEELFLGRGVSYCAVCDGNLYKGKKIAVICYEKQFESEAKFLAELSAQTVFVPLYKNCELTSPKIKLKNTPPIAFEGDTRLRRVRFKDGVEEVDGAFILKSAVSPEILVHGLKTEGGHISVDRAQKTNIEGIFAAGDCTGRPYQYAKSVGEGNVAAHSAVEYLAEKGL